MKYPLFDELPKLRADGLISGRRHPDHPLTVFNYTAKAQHTPVAEWTEAMCDCRGLILDDDGEIIGRPFRKFWNLEQVQDRLPDGDFTVWEKLDGSLGIVCSYAGERIVATRGSFESEQAIWFRRWLGAKHENFTPSGETWLFELIYPENRIVVDYGDRKEAVLLAVMSPDGVDLPQLFECCQRFRRARRFDGLREFSAIDTNPQFAGQEGFVVQWSNGFRCKVKLEEYKRLHRLITQCSTRTIWELLRAGSGTKELLDRVPEEFGEWVKAQTLSLISAYNGVLDQVALDFHDLAPLSGRPRKVFAEAAKKRKYTGLLFALLDQKDITDTVWRIVEPKWATPFRKDADIESQALEPSGLASLKIFMTRGLQASGKTTWAKDEIAKYPGRYKRLNKDDLRAMLDGGKWSRDNESFVLRTRDLLIQEALDHGKHVIVDDTNGHPKHEARLREIAETWSKFTGSLSNPERLAAVEVVDFTHVPIEECIRRDLLRPVSVGEKVIRDTYNQFFAPPPTIYAEDKSIPTCVICDIDGTVALMNGRQPYEEDKVHTDRPNRPVVDLVQTLHASGETIIFCSARHESARAKTEAWLNEHVLLGENTLFMRPDGDDRKDHVVKAEIFEREFRGKWRIRFCLDDRKRVVDGWRQLGIPCFQVAPGNF